MAKNNLIAVTIYLDEKLYRAYANKAKELDAKIKEGTVSTAELVRLAMSKAKAEIFNLKNL